MLGLVFAICAAPGVYATPVSVRAGAPVEVTVLGGSFPCIDVVVIGPSPTPTPSVTPVSVTVFMTRAGARVTLGTLTQNGYGAHATFRVPRSTAPGDWTLHSSTGLDGTTPLHVLRGTLPRTGGREPAALAATGVMLLVAGAFAVAAAGRLPAPPPWE